MMQALIFDCDGVLVDTEKDGHRVAFNTAFETHGIDAHWGVREYHDLLQVAGGKERMRFYFDRNGWPEAEAERDALIKDLHATKSAAFQDLLRGGKMTLRPGVARLVDEARAADMALAVCSTSKLESVQACVDLLGPDRANAFSFILAGDAVSRKKPDPEIYLTAAERLDLPASQCLVIEDSEIGCRAATSAGMRCVVTTSAYTASESFEGAYRVVPELGDGANAVPLVEIAT
ncbi:HAD-IA family hydrolase [Aurantiacibacter gangjinensis]|uniref:Uncharacterized protein n=1 Tax=Aurantiacibacter gangjinensis TaxID=502682 RepID=A0A0G9MKU0_9SPHN|nr:HAD-IA family hydrolase [Aurantiacibacter gangjinensis]APE27167.1 hypothetical protein BMF35_a0338 [Aurantiacibacter gangjinensis]KLE31305.1 hypothetical protein AAW01_06710 [Aurantiacibacter gangjinensis]